MDILLVEGNARRRAAVIRHLSGYNHQVTAASSLDEAHELLNLAKAHSSPPRFVIFDERLLDRIDDELREELGRRFPGIDWIPLRADLELEWLSAWLDKIARRREVSRRRTRAPRLNVMVIEGDPVLREAMGHRLRLRGDKVISCASVAEAREVLADLADGDAPPQAIVAPVSVDGCDVMRLFLTAKSRHADLRWVVTTPRPDLPNL